MPSEQCKLAIREYEEHQQWFTKAKEAASKSASKYEDFAESFGHPDYGEEIVPGKNYGPPGWRTYFLSIYKMNDHYTPSNEHDEARWEDGVERIVLNELAALENGLMKEYLFKVLNECKKG